MVLAIYENGEYLKAIGVMLFYQMGEWSQGYAAGKSRQDISALMDIRPDYANVERGGGEGLNRLTLMKLALAVSSWSSREKRCQLMVSL